MRHSLLLSALPGIAMDGRAADRRSFLRLCPGMPIVGPRAVAVPPDNKQPVSPIMSTAHSEDARAESEAPLFHRGCGRQPMGPRNRRLLPRRQAFAHARLRAGDGAVAGTRRWVIARRSGVYSLTGSESSQHRTMHIVSKEFPLLLL